jgi:hypothetical protein
VIRKLISLRNKEVKGNNPYNLFHSLFIHPIMSKEKEGKKKQDKTAPSKTPKEKKAEKTAKRNEKGKAE